MKDKSYFINWIIFIINIFLVLGFVFLISTMFIKNMDLVYIICTFLIALLPLSNVYKYFKMIKKE
ncbi:hypothetical protein BU122_13900 [Staphylococcus xylosus]|nr:hypothetical protein BU122_13900 [Staphylococcus xylosus]